MLNIKNDSSKSLFNSIDGLRTIGIFGIVIMHVFANSKYLLSGFIFNNIIANFGTFVGMFFIISGFGMCCGYYEKMLGNGIDLVYFYRKRFLKIFPFFALLTIMDLIINFPHDSIYEIISNLTLLFGFYTNSDISVIGVGWFLGVLFVFYCIFPFFCTCVSSKKKAWITFAICLFFNYACRNYFLVDGKVVNCNILLWSPFFTAGAIIFHYKDFFINLGKSFKNILFFINILLTIGFYIIPDTIGNININHWKLLLLFSAWISFAISGEYKILSNKLTSFITNISLEIYLSHMVFYRAVERLSLLYLFKNHLISYIFSCFIIIVFTIVFSWIIKNIFIKIEKKIYSKKQKNNI